jgi:CheY-like chemotaxis protein/HPt (histidine-containing phosphotransfer) domain-containing protein
MTNTERRYRLLIVDDNTVDRRFYRGLLTEQTLGGCEIRQAADGAEGLAALRAQTPDCVLLACSLPDMTGLEFLAEAAGPGELPCAVVLVAGHGNAAIAVAAMQRGAQDYLVKDQLNAGNLWHAITSAVAETELRASLADALRELAAANAALCHKIAVRQTVETDLRHARDIAEQVNQASTRFVATVINEMRAPLDRILGDADLLRIEGGLSARQALRVRAMTQAGRQLLKLIGGDVPTPARPDTTASLPGRTPAPSDAAWNTGPANSPLMPLSPPQSPQPATGRRVLLVDDIEMNHEVIGAYLRAAGHAAVVAHSGQQAVQLARDQKFDLILMDLRMPGMDGHEATRRIRMLPGRHGCVPILALTAATLRREQLEQCQQAGMDGHIAKQVDYTTLMVAVANAIATPTSRWTADAVPAATAGIAADAQIAAGTGVGHGNAPEAPAQPQFVRATLDETLSFLSPEQAAAQLQSLRGRNAQMLRLLDQPATPALLTEAAHTLASAAGMFGFAALSAVARGFEQALEHGTPEADRLGQCVRAETCAALTALDTLVHECRMQPA